MRSPQSPAQAIAWEFRRRHLRVLIALAGYLLVLAAIKLLMRGLGQPITLEPPDGRVGVALGPLSVTFFYFLAVFSFGLAGDLAARQSIYPARMFTLPVTTRALAGWPMLYGSAVMASLWLGMALLARWWDLALPVIWPALLAAVFLAWTQALTWMPYGWRGVRVVVTVLWLAALDVIVLLAIHFKVSEPLMIGFLAPQLPLAYLTARFAVARARRGDIPDWRGMRARPAAIAQVSQPGHFPSPARAQLWFEWRRHGRTLPALVALLLPFELAFLFLVRHDPPVLIFETLLVVLLTPPFMATFAATMVSRANPHARDSYGVTPFDATRPMTSAGLIGAKLGMAIWSTLGAWLLVLVAIPLGLKLSGTWPTVIGWVDWLARVFGTPRAIVILLLVFSSLIVSTWKQLVHSMYIGLTGRVWVIRTSWLFALAFIIMIGPVAQWIIDDRAVAAGVWTALPWILAALVGVKMIAAAWVAQRLYSSRLLSDRMLVTGAAGWMVAVLLLYGLLAWAFFAPLIPRYLLGLVAILAMPLARLSAAPLALAWNRHR
ncbi:MAG TPA: hypothetical protein VGP80_12265 [Gemmatimonadales bacterium]|nr:hypothetical protein [Gemmatimonadales bacterium]